MSWDKMLKVESGSWGRAFTFLESLQCSTGNHRIELDYLTAVPIDNVRYILLLISFIDLLSFKNDNYTRFDYIASVYQKRHMYLQIALR